MSNYIRSIVAMAIISINSPVFAENASRTMQSFGLTGTLSTDCARPALRFKYVYPSFGNPIHTWSIKTQDESEMFEFEIVSATLVTVEKLKVTMMLISRNGVKIPNSKPIEEEPTLYEKFGNKFKVGRLEPPLQDHEKLIIGQCLN